VGKPVVHAAQPQIPAHAHQQVNVVSHSGF